MNRDKVTKTMKKRLTGQIKAVRHRDGHYNVIFANKHGSSLTNYPLQQLQRWVRTDSYRRYCISHPRLCASFTSLYLLSGGIRISYKPIAAHIAIQEELESED